MEIKTANIECPHCGRIQIQDLKEPAEYPHVYLCSDEKRGCGRFYVAKIDVLLEPRVNKIEGRY